VWEAGVDGAKPGSIYMQALPKVKETYLKETYRQEYYEGKAMDTEKVLSLNESATVPYGFFDHLLITEDWNSLDSPSRGGAQVLRSRHRKCPRGVC
jgi:hypothetical protein